MEQDTTRQNQVQDWIEHQPVTTASIDISIIVPAYNEEWRLPPSLIDIVDHFDARGTNYEVLVVDDGSTDNTSTIVAKFERIRNAVRLIRLPRNHGKGYAVRTGVLNARGQFVLFADADGSTPIREIDRLRIAIDGGADIAIGSRAMHSDETRVITRWYRKYLGRLFNLCVNVILLPGVADTQCGFKLFRRSAARFVFEQQRANRYSFDVEILYIARKAGLRVDEVPVNWQNVPGSKVNLILDACRMFCDIVVFRMTHGSITPQVYQKFSAAFEAGNSQAIP